jgi:hypothetical protein
MDPIAIAAVLGLAVVGKKLSESYVADVQAESRPVVIEKPRENIVPKLVYSIAGGLNAQQHVNPPSTRKNSALPSFQVPNFKPVHQTPVNYNSDRVFDTLTSITRNVNPVNKSGKALLTTAPGLGLGTSINPNSNTPYGGGGQGFHYGAVQPVPILTNADVLVNGTAETGTRAGTRGASVVPHTPLAPAISGYSVGGITEPPALVVPVRDFKVMPDILPNNLGGPKQYSAPPDALYNVFPTNRDQILAPQTGGLTVNPQIYRPSSSTYQKVSDIRSKANTTVFKGTSQVTPESQGKVTTLRTDSQFLNYVIPNMTRRQTTAPLGTVTLNSIKGQMNPRNTMESLGATTTPLQTNQFAIPSFSIQK